MSRGSSFSVSRIDIAAASATLERVRATRPGTTRSRLAALLRNARSDHVDEICDSLSWVSSLDDLASASYEASAKGERVPVGRIIIALAQIVRDDSQH